jgi:serine/threonine-protein kinase
MATIAGPDTGTLVRPATESPRARGLSSALPPDLLHQIRGRVRLLAVLLFIAFSFDLVVYAGNWLAIFAGYPAPAGFLETGAFQFVNLAAAVASAALWWVSRSPRISATRLHTLGLIYEVAICFLIATLTFWQYFVTNGILPNLTWVPVVIILFPLIMPGPPGRMLGAAVAAGAMAPIAMWRLDAAGRVVTTPDSYVQVTVHSAFAVGFAYSGAKLIYGLGRELTAARELGSYRLVERLGHGGMGDVWRAEHRMLARPAAIKLIRPVRMAGGRAEVTEEARQRFEREAQTIAGLRSPHTINLFDFGVATDGAFYYVMELLDGFDLQALVERFGPVPLGRAVNILAQVCHSLAEAHEHGLIHRDIKPANVCVCRYGRDVDFVKVLDFGLVKPLERDQDPTQLALSATHAVRGTPAFMSPEQAVGDRPVDARTDIYAVGCLGYWLVTGEHVFPGRTPIDTIVKHLQAEPLPPSRRSAQHVPPTFDDLVLACLAKDPADRPATAETVARRLRTIAPDSAWTADHARQWWDRHHPESSAAQTACA